MKSLLFAAVALLASAAPAFAQCGEDDVGSMPFKADAGTSLILNNAYAGTQHWTLTTETIGADTFEVCHLDAYVFSTAGVAYFLETGSYGEPLLESGGVGAPTFETSWKCGGMTHKVVTPKQGGDSSTTWAKKHKTAVDALQALYPPDPPELVLLMESAPFYGAIVPDLCPIFDDVDDLVVV